MGSQGTRGQGQREDKRKFKWFGKMRVGGRTGIGVLTVRTVREVTTLTLTLSQRERE
jgi:hypothetical protein